MLAWVGKHVDDCTHAHNSIILYIEASIHSFFTYMYIICIGQKMSLRAVRKLEGKVAVLTASTSGYVVMSLSLKSLTLAIYSFVATLLCLVIFVLLSEEQ